MGRRVHDCGCRFPAGDRLSSYGGYGRLVEAKTCTSLLPDPAKCELYSAERQTEALIRALDGYRRQSHLFPGSAEVPPSLREEMKNPYGQAIRELERSKRVVLLVSKSRSSLIRE